METGVHPSPQRISQVEARRRQEDKGSSRRISDKGKSSYLQRLLQRLFPCEILDDVKKELESFTENVTCVLKEGKLESI